MDVLPNQFCLITVRSLLKSATIILLMSFATIGCQHRLASEQLPTWERFFPSDDRLIGVRVQQHPDDGDQESHHGMHPAMVLYVFNKSGTLSVCQVGFTPDGAVDSVFWWGPPENWVLEQLQPHPRQ